MATAQLIGALCGLLVFGAWLALESDRGPAAGVCIVLLSGLGLAAVAAAVL